LAGSILVRLCQSFHDVAAFAKGDAGDLARLWVLDGNLTVEKMGKRK